MDAGPGAPSLEAGAIIGGRYRLVRALGEGAMGWVWHGSHIHTGKTYALKFLKGGKDEDRRRFQREVRAAAAVKHPNVVGMHDFVELPSGMLVMVMDLLEGETLGAVLKREKRIELTNLAAIALPVIAALEAAHAVGVIHRDLKPENIFLAKADDGTTIVPKVLDFGVAKLTAAEGLAARTQALTGTGSMVGTPYYMSPEQVVSEKDLDARADVWSLGVVLYECLAGVRPTEADNVGRVLKRILMADFEPLSKLRSDLPSDVSALVMKMLEGERDKRTRALSDVRAVLAKHAGEKIEAMHADPDAVGAHEPPAPASFSRADTHRAVSVHAAKTSRSPLRFVVIGAAALAGAGALVAWKGTAPATTPAAMPAVVESAPPPAQASTDPAPAPIASIVSAQPPATPAPSSSPASIVSAPAPKSHAASKPATAVTTTMPSATAGPRSASVVVSAPSPGTASAAPPASAPSPRPATTIATSPKD